MTTAKRLIHLRKCIIFIFLTAGIIFYQPLRAQYTPTNVQDSLALVDLFNSTNGPAWSFPWDLEKPVPTWHGVVFTSESGFEGRVIGLSLSRNNMSGPIPASIANLTVLRTLSLWSNQLTGSIPETIGSISSLTNIDLSSNTLTGTIPESIGNLQAVTYLALSHNQLSGPAPKGLSLLTGLQFLVLNDNYFDFDGFEAVYTNLVNTVLTIAPQAKLNIHKKAGILTVYAGGNLYNNTYTWHNDYTRKDTVITGDSAFIPLDSGAYTVTVKNALINRSAQYWLYSNSIIASPLKLFAINPNPIYLQPDGSVIRDVSGIPLGTNAKGAATDGTTKILLLVQSTVPVSFYLDDNTNGMLSSLDAQDVPEQVLAVTPVNGRAAVIYHVPDGYGAASPRGGRYIHISVADGSGEGNTINFKLESPPVVLVHGMWSSPAVWNDGHFIDSLQANGLNKIYPADYSAYSYFTYAPDNNESIYGRVAVESAVKQALVHNTFTDSIITTQVDIVGHSLGGLMSRSYSQQPGFAGLGNYYKGYYHKLITLGTPHRGSPLGPLLWNNRNKIIVSHVGAVPLPLTLAALMALAGKPVGSVHRDFGIESPGQQSLTQTLPYKTYAVTANYFPQVQDYIALNFVTATVLNTSLDQLFASRCDPKTIISSDVIVPSYSQRGYIAHYGLFQGTSHSTIVPGSNTETNSSDIQTSVAALLLSNDGADFSDGFPSPSAQPLDCNTTSYLLAANPGKEQTTNLLPQNDTGNYVQIVSPLTGTSFVKGNDTITLEYSVQGTLQTDSAVFFIQDAGIFPMEGDSLYKRSFVLGDNIPAGVKHIVLMVKDKSGTIYADTSSVMILPAGKADSVAAEPASVQLDSVLRQSAITLMGFYKQGDGYHRENISSAVFGTAYQPLSIQGICTVSPDGLVTAIKPGKDTIKVVYEGWVFFVPVTVDSNFSKAIKYSNSISFDNIADQDVNAAPFTVDATSSSGRPVYVEILSGPATIQNGIVTLTGTGTVVIRATSPGDVYFDDASPVIQSFQVTGVLPLSLLDFRGSVYGKDVLLHWFTGYERALKNFIVMRSFDAVNYDPVATVPATGSVSGSTYNIKDMLPSYGAGKVWYYLQAVDKDGTKINSGLINLLLSQQGQTLSVSPNPAHDYLALRIFCNTAGYISIRVNSVEGKNLYQQKLQVCQGINTFLVPVKSFANGMYYVSVYGDKLSLHQAFLKQ